MTNPLWKFVWIVTAAATFFFSMIVADAIVTPELRTLYVALFLAVLGNVAWNTAYTVWSVEHGTS